MRRLPVASSIWSLILCASFLVLLVAASDSGDVSTPTAEASPGGGPDPIDSILVPGAMAGEIPEPLVPWGGPVPVAAPAPGDHGSVGTDGGLGTPAPQPNALELRKLEMARLAVAQAGGAAVEGRATAPSEGPLDPPGAHARGTEAITPVNIPSIPPALLPPDAAAGVGDDLPSIQESGPAGLTPEEVEKLNALRSAPAPAPKPSSDEETGGREGR